MARKEVKTRKGEGVLEEIVWFRTKWTNAAEKVRGYTREKRGLRSKKERKRVQWLKPEL